MVILLSKKKEALRIDKKKLKKIRQIDSVDMDEIVTKDEPYPYQDDMGKF